MSVLEREGVLAQLQAQWRGATEGPGRLVFVEGEAGIGKTTLLRAFTQPLRLEVPVLRGACEAMRATHALAPLDDIAAQSPGLLREALAALAAGGARHPVFVAFVDLLARTPTVAVLEDLHWADEATLDLLRYAGRRIAHTRSLLLASYRSDELVPAHPLRAVLGDLATGRPLRVTLQPLSLPAVALLCNGVADAAELHRRTGGNPFFVSEVLASGDDTVPATVQDAVLARAARLAPGARAVLDVVAIAGPRVDAGLLQVLAGADGAALDECLATGVLLAEQAVFFFRHELARQAVLQTLTPSRAIGLHRAAVRALAARGDPQQADAARLALHADGAGDADEVRRWAPIAAREAAARGAHRQAAAHWRVMLKHLPRPEEQAALLDDYAVELQASGSLAEAIAARQASGRLWRELGKPARAATAQARLGLLFVLGGRNAEGEAALRDAQALVVDSDDAAARLAVQNCAAGLRMLDRDCDDAIALAAPALAEAERRSDSSAVVDALTTIGAAQLASERVDDGIAQLERALALAQRLGRDRAVAQILANLGAGCTEVMKLDCAERFLTQGIAFCADRDLDAPRLYQSAWLAQVQLLKGYWNAAAATAREVLANARATAIARITALVVLGRLRVRRGEPDAWAALDEARELAVATGTVQRLAPMQAARAEAAWLEGRDADAAREAAAGLPLALSKVQAGFAAELLLWRRRGGKPDALPDFCAHRPSAIEAAGRWQEAAAAWRALACPFETARTLADGDEAAQRDALALFESLGAAAMADRVRQRLRAAGAHGVPRGPRASTREHAAQITTRELAVLGLLAAGLRNKEIATRLSRSPRTVDHHVEAIFAKLGVATRVEAVSAAHRLGLIAPDPPSPRPR